MKALRLLGLFVLLFVSVQLLAQTQITTGVIQGTLTDPSGAVIAGASVEATNPDTNFSRTLTTDNNGRFVFLGLPPGAYKLKISAKGFATVLQENLNLTVGQAISLNVPMKVSTAAEQIVVTDTPTLDPTKTESSTTLTPTTIATTPVLGRKFEDLLTLTPGVSIVQGPDGDEITFAGQRGIFNNVSLDGGDYNNGFFGEQMGGQRAAIDITMEAVQEFQVVATGASAEFGRTAGGVINVITKSGTNNVHGSLFHFQRLEALTSNTSDGKSLRDFRREQFGGTIGGPIVRSKMFFFGAFEQIFENLTRDNLSTQLGSTPCPVPSPTITANEAQIAATPDCQRLALLGFFRTRLDQEEGLPIKHPIRNTALLAKYDWNVAANHKLSASFNFDRSHNQNQTFDVPTYGNSANGIEGPSIIQAYNVNFFSTVSPKKFNEAHFTYSRENRPRAAVESNVPPDTGMGFEPTFRFGNPYFLGPTVDEIFWRTQVRDNFSILTGSHNIKFGGDWTHSLNDQVFRGFFRGRYIFDSVTGFLRYASPASLGAGFGPNAGLCTNGTWTDLTAPSCAGATTPLLLFLQGADRTGPATDAAGASTISNEDFALFIQDKWQVRPNFTLNYGLRWEAQIFPDPVVPPAETAYGPYLNDPLFPSNGTLPNQTKMFQPRIGFAWDITNKQKSVLRANWGIYNGHQNMLTQVGSITTNGVQQQTIAGGTTANPFVRPTWPGLAPVTPVPAGTFPPFSGVRAFEKTYKNPRIYTANVAFEQELVPNVAAYADFTWSKGVYLTTFYDAAKGFTALDGTQVPANNWAQFDANFNCILPVCLGETMITSSRAKALYRGGTFGVRKRFSHGFQLEANYVISKDLDNDSNERDPFVDRRCDFFDLGKCYTVSDRDIRHKFNFFSYAELPHGFQLNLRLQARSAQPITPAVKPAGCFRNCERKDNVFTSFDWRAARPFKIGERYRVIPTIEMFNTFNNKNNINPLISPGLFNFDGFLRQGVGDPRQVQLALKFTF
jgi:hypothetical protein